MAKVCKWARLTHDLGITLQLDQISVGDPQLFLRCGLARAQARDGWKSKLLCGHGMDNSTMERTVWGHLPLLVRANSKESVEYILEALWRTRKIGLDDADRSIIREMLQLNNDAELDPLLVCLRMLIRRCVYENINKDEIQKLFPNEVLPELQRLLTLLLLKFQREWQQDISKDQVALPHLKAMTWNMANQNSESTDPIAVINLKLQNDGRSNSGEMDVKFQLAKDTLETMLKSMYCIRDQLCDNGESEA